MKQISIYLALLSTALLTLGTSKGTADEVEINSDPDITFVEDSDISADLADASEGRVTDDPIEAAYFGVYVWKAAVEKAGTLTSTRYVRRFMA